MAEFCLHIANCFYLLSFLGRDILWLRAFTCVGLVLGIVFFSCQPIPLYGPVAWHVVFLGINLVEIRRLVVERRELRLSAEQERLAEMHFRELSREELLTLLTRVMCARAEMQHDFERICRQPLSPEERALRDIAFSRLSRQELMNLLIRRVWNSLKRRNPLTRRRRHEAPVTADGPGPMIAPAIPARSPEDEWSGGGVKTREP